MDMTHILMCMLSCFNHVQPFACAWTADCCPPSRGFSKQELCSGLAFPPPRDRSHPGTEPTSPAAPVPQVDSLPLTHGGSHPFFLKFDHHTDRSSYIQSIYFYSRKFQNTTYPAEYRHQSLYSHLTFIHSNNDYTTSHPNGKQFSHQAQFN